jgi:hypothetical protein
VVVEVVATVAVAVDTAIAVVAVVAEAVASIKDGNKITGPVKRPFFYARYI